MELKLKHLSAYLPYKLKIDTEGYFYEMVLTSIELTTILEKKWKPILRPLSDLFKQIEFDGEKFVPIEKLHSLFRSGAEESLDDFCHRINMPIDFLPRVISEKYMEWHFDYFNLIEKGLAVDFNKV
jgi:hypothetical protein